MHSHVPLPDKDGRIEILCLDLRNAKFKNAQEFEKRSLAQQMED